MATMKQKLVSAFKEMSDLLIWQICSAMSANDLITFLKQTISKCPFDGHLEFLINIFDIYKTKKKQSSWTMNIKPNVMSHKRMGLTHDKFRTNNIQNGRQSVI